MSSGVIPTDGSVCCICWQAIPAGENGKDRDGQAWDVHDGDCAIQAGLWEDPLPIGVRHWSRVPRWSREWRGPAAT